MAALELETIKTLSQFSNLVAYYRFENGALTTDSSGNSHTLTNNNSVAGNASGKFGYCADQGSTNTTKFFHIADALDVDGGEITISLWVKNLSDIASGGPWGFANQYNTNNDVCHGIRYEYNGGTRRLYFDRWKCGVADEGPTYNLTMGTANWYNIVYTYDGTYVRGYVNGELVAGPTTASGTGDKSTASRSNNFTIGTISVKAGVSFGSYHSMSLIDDAFVLSGTALTASQIKAIYEGYFVNASAGSFTLTGKNTVFSVGHTLAYSYLTFALTGKATTLTKALSIIVSVGAFTLTGIATILTKALNLITAVGAFTLTSVNTTLTKALSIIVSAGSFTLTGIAGILTRGYTLISDVGEFALTGIDIIFNKTLSLMAEVGEFTLTSIATILTRALNMTLAVGNFALTGI
jgi:hypothetical protein